MLKMVHSSNGFNGNRPQNHLEESSNPQNVHFKGPGLVGLNRALVSKCVETSLHQPHVCPRQRGSSPQFPPPNEKKSLLGALVFAHAFHQAPGFQLESPKDQITRVDWFGFLGFLRSGAVAVALVPVSEQDFSGPKIRPLFSDRVFA